MVQEFDYHIHTTFSDGQYDVSEIIEQLKKLNINNFSIADHDNIDSIKVVKSMDISNMHFINGVEISSILDNKYKLHILGYFFDENNKNLNDLLERLQKARKQRFLELVEYVYINYDLCFSKADIENIVNNVNTPGKPHLADLMVKYKYVNDVAEAFQKYLDSAKTKTSNRLPAEDVISTINMAGGIAIWAHPKKVEKKYNVNFAQLMPRLLNLGLSGIEIFNSLHSFDDCVRYLNYSKHYKLLVSGGSDYHGEKIKRDVKLGVVYSGNDQKIIDISIMNFRERGNNDE